MDEPAILHGIVLDCNSHRDHAVHEVECVNAWAAVERLGQADDARRDVKREQDFEQSRAKLRLAREREANSERDKPFDPYRSPVTADPGLAAGTR